MAEILVVANEKAGSAEPERLEAALSTLRSAADVEVATTSSKGELETALDRLGERRLVIAGGDGSVHLVVGTLAQRDQLDAPIGLVPLGTGNDLARGVDVPLEPEPAAEVCLDGRARALDVIAVDDGTIVVNASHAGLGAAAAGRSDRIKETLGPLAYPLGALIAGASEAGYQLRVEVDGAVVHDGETLMVGVLNGPCIGGGARLCVLAAPDDGQLDVVVVSAVGPAARVAFGAALRRGAHLDREDVQHVRGRQVSITGDPVIHDIDGELNAETTARTYTVQPARWCLLVPRV